MRVSSSSTTTEQSAHWNSEIVFPHTFLHAYCLDTVSIPFLFSSSCLASCLHIITLKYDFHFEKLNLSLPHIGIHVCVCECVCLRMHFRVTYKTTIK